MINKGESVGKLAGFRSNYWIDGGSIILSGGLSDTSIENIDFDSSWSRMWDDHPILLENIPWSMGKLIGKFGRVNGGKQIYHYVGQMGLEVLDIED